MASWLAMDKTQGIIQLFAVGMSERQIAGTLDIDRKSVDRELRLQGQKGPNRPPAPKPIKINENWLQKGPIF
jgi:IS30 family transposase